MKKRRETLKETTSYQLNQKLLAKRGRKVLDMLQVTLKMRVKIVVAMGPSLEIEMKWAPVQLQAVHIPPVQLPETPTLYPTTADLRCPQAQVVVPFPPIRLCIHILTRRRAMHRAVSRRVLAIEEVRTGLETRTQRQQPLVGQARVLEAQAMEAQILAA